MSYLIRINSASLNAKPVYARRLRLNAERVYKTPASALVFRKDIDANAALGTEYFSNAGLIGSGNSISPAKLWEHLSSIEKAAALHDFSFVEISPRAAFMNTEGTGSVKNEIFHAVMGRLLDPETPGNFVSKYKCPDTQALEIDNALISLFREGTRNIWDRNKPLFDGLGLRIDLTGAVFPELKDGTYDGIDLDDTILANSRIFLKSFRNASVRNSFMRGADLSCSNLTGADLSDSDMENADLSYVKLNNASLARTRLNGTCMSLTDLSGADLTLAQLLGVKKASTAVFDGCDMAFATVQNYLEMALGGHDIRNRNLITWVAK